MDDQELERFLKELTPKKAPGSMDDPVLKAALSQGSEKMGLLKSLLMAAVLLITVGLVFLLQPSPKKETMSGGVLMSEAQIAPLEEALEARALLLELKLSRLRKKTDFSENRRRYRTDLGMLENRLKAINKLGLKRSSVVEKKPSDPMEDKGGSKNEDNIKPMDRHLDFHLGRSLLPG